MCVLHWFLERSDDLQETQHMRRCMNLTEIPPPPPPPGFIMTVSRPCYFGNLLLGVVGVDVNLAYILEDVTYYQDSLASYTFLIDNKGQRRRLSCPDL